MRALVFQGDGIPRLGPVENDIFVHDPDRRKGPGDRMRPAGDVPTIANERHAYLQCNGGIASRLTLEIHLYTNEFRISIYPQA